MNVSPVPNAFPCSTAGTRRYRPFSSASASSASHAFPIENGRVVMAGTSDALRADPDLQEFYPGAPIRPTTTR